MKKFITICLILMLTISAIAEITSPTLKNSIITNPIIDFEIATNIEETVALNPIYELFGTNIASKFSVIEALDFTITEDMECVEFTFIEYFTEEDTVILVFDYEESEVFFIFTEIEEGKVIVDFTLIPNGFTRMYVVSDYDR